MKIGLVGYGSIAGAHVRALSGLDVEVVGVMGRLAEPAEAFAREHGVPHATTDLDELLGLDGLEGIVVCSPTDAHAEQSARALRAGKHVLCEIPLATSLTETDQLIRLADEQDRRLMVCHTQRYYPGLVEARRLIATGELHPHAVVARYGFLRRENVNWMGRRRSWTDNLIWHHGCHAVDTCLWLLGRAVVDVAPQVALPGPALGIPMDLSVLIRTEADQVVTVAMSYNTHIPVQDYLVVGEETTVLYADGDLRDRERVLVAKPTAHDPIRDQDLEFLGAVRERREPAVSGRAVRTAMAALQRVQDWIDHRLMVDG
ncbi:MAG TPA: Gfo/Idh/MocA family oxidoreductase [Chloroflexota bacterium]|nr:Gfo/Idh/MocA family oxidoreductase [Chloroflexota bacterium]